MLADHWARKYFPDCIYAPTKPIRTKFMSKLAELTLLQKYVISIVDANHKANNVTLLRMPEIASNCAFGFDSEESGEYSILDKEFVR